jgi:hypothetical protein
MSCEGGTRRPFSSPRISRSRRRWPTSAARTPRGRSIRGASGYSLFGVLIAAAVRSIALKPRLNRFVHRRGVYQRKGISVSFIVKKSLTEGATEGSAKIRFESRGRHRDGDGEDSNEGIDAARGGAPGPDDREFDLAHRLPFGKAAMTFLFQRIFDRFNVAPPRMVEADPLFTSVYIRQPWLYRPRYALSPPLRMGHGERLHGRRQDIPEGVARSQQAGASGAELRHFVNVKFTVDERIAEGIYFAHAAALFQRLVAKPETLELPPDLSEAEA